MEDRESIWSIIGYFFLALLLAPVFFVMAVFGAVVTLTVFSVLVQFAVPILLLIGLILIIEHLCDKE